MSVADDAVAKIRELIQTGRLRPGDRLPEENTLADEFGISRNSMREAVRALEQSGVLRVRHGSGTYVTSLEPALLLEGFAFAFNLLGGTRLPELLEVRQMLEPLATRLAAERMTDEKLESIRLSLEGHREQTTIEELVKHDLAFHSAIIRACGNETLATILEGIAGETLRMRIWAAILDENGVSKAHVEHGAIFSALEERNPRLAEAASLLHVTSSSRALQAIVDAEAFPE